MPTRWDTSPDRLPDDADGPAPNDPASRAPFSLGIDLGTSSVAAAVTYRGCAQPAMVRLGERSITMPSVAFVADDGGVCFGESAERRALADPSRAATGFKRRLGDPTPLRLGERSRSADQLLAGLLGEVLDVVALSENGVPEHVVITHPATWGSLRLRLLERIARDAGVRHLGLVPEPVAAALHHTNLRQVPEPELVAVYDLGGGTFDVTVVRAHEDRVEILGRPEGIERLGGLDFDDALFRHIDHLTDGAYSEADLTDPETAAAEARLRRECLLAKERLSEDPVAVVPVRWPDAVDIEVTRAEFEDLIRVHVESTVGAVQRAVRSAGLAPDELARILLVGGGSRVPLVGRMVAERLGRPVLAQADPKFAVALGAARVAARHGGWTNTGGGGTRAEENADPVLPAGPIVPSRPHVMARLLAASAAAVVLMAIVTYAIFLSGPPLSRMGVAPALAQGCAAPSCGPRVRADDGFAPARHPEPGSAAAPPVAAPTTSHRASARPLGTVRSAYRGHVRGEAVPAARSSGSVPKEFKEPKEPKESKHKKESSR